MVERNVGDVKLEVPNLDNKKVEVKIGTVLRMLFLLVTYINQACDTIGVYDMFIPSEYRTVIAAVSLIATGVASVCAYWFNNSWSAEATVADKLLATIKHASKYCPDIVTAVENSVMEFNKKQVAAASELNIPASSDLMKNNEHNRELKDE